MELVLAIFIGFLFGSAVFCLLRRSIFRLIIGIMLLAHAANLLVFVSAGLTEENPPIIKEENTTLLAGAADPLPQALVLTAIVIGFGVIAFCIALIHRAERAVDSDDMNAFNRTEVEK